MTFQRARQDKQKAERSANILTRARELCAESGVMGWSLNELGRRADITKSNLYRYFGSREEILMMLMYEETERFIHEFENKVHDRSLTINELCQLMAETYEQNPLLCDLLSISATILEQNTNLEPMREIKLASVEHSGIMAKAIESCTAEINFDSAMQFAFASGIIVMGLWPLASPEAPIRQLTQFEGLECLNFDFRSELEKLLKAQIRGLIY